MMRTWLRAVAFGALVVGSSAGCQLLPYLQGHVPASPMSCVEGTYQLQSTGSQPVTADILDQTHTIIENRMNATGLVPFSVRANAPDQIVVAFPASDRQDAIRNLVGKTGQLLFIPVPTAYANSITEGQPLPTGMPATPIFGGDQIASPRPGTTQAGLPAVDLLLKDRGAQLFDEYAAAHYGERFAIVLDGIVEAAPTINASRFDGQLQISGTFTIAEVNDLVTLLKYGYLPLPLKEVGFGPGGCSGAGA